MIIVRSILALLVLAVAAIVAVYWETAIAPQWMARQALRQMEVHTDGQGDRLAAERRMATLVQHWPAELASAVGILASLGLIFGGEKLRDAGAVSVCDSLRIPAEPAGIQNSPGCPVFIDNAGLNRGTGLCHDHPDAKEQEP